MLIRPTDLDASNRKLLAAARQVGLNADEIIRKSLEAAYGNLLRDAGGRRQGRATAVAQKSHIHNSASMIKAASKSAPKNLSPGIYGEQRRKSF